MRSSQHVVVAKPSPPLFRYEKSGDIGGQIGTLQAAPGDTLSSCGKHVGGAFSKSYYLLTNDPDTVWVTDGDVLSLDDYAFSLQLTKFRLPKDQDPGAWARATQYIVNHSDMKVQTASDNLIQTYNPIDGAKIGFTITRVPMGDYVEYDVVCMSPNMFVDRVGHARRLAYFMVTGIEHR
jgi:hypothetical protein